MRLLQLLQPRPERTGCDHEGRCSRVLLIRKPLRYTAADAKRIILRHVAEPSAQRLLLEKGDIDLARNLTPDQVKGIEGNPDNRAEAKLTGVLAWRNAWAVDEINAMTVAARNELDPVKREQLYLDLRKRLQTEGPFVIMFQQSEQVAQRTNVEGFVSGSNFDQVYYRNVTK